MCVQLQVQEEEDKTDETAAALCVFACSVGVKAHSGVCILQVGYTWLWTVGSPH